MAFSPSEWDLLTPTQRRYFLIRSELLRRALEDGLIHEKQLKPALRDGKGVDWDSLGPLFPKERTAVLCELRKMWRLPPDPNDKVDEIEQRLIKLPYQR